MQKTPSTSSERLMYVQFPSFVYRDGWKHVRRRIVVTSFVTKCRRKHEPKKILKGKDSELETLFVKKNFMKNIGGWLRNWKLEIENFILGMFAYFSYWLDIYLPRHICIILSCITKISCV